MAKKKTTRRRKTTKTRTPERQHYEVIFLETIESHFEVYAESEQDALDCITNGFNHRTAVKFDEPWKGRPLKCQPKEKVQ